MNKKFHEFNERVITFSILFLALFAFGWFLNLTKSFVVPFVIAILFSYTLIPVAKSLEKLKIPIVINTIIIIIGVFIVLFIISMILYGSFISIKDKVPEYTTRLNIIISETIQYLNQYLEQKIPQDFQIFSINKLIRLINPASLLKTVNQGLEQFIVFVSKFSLVMLFLIFILISRKTLEKKKIQLLKSSQYKTKFNLDVFSTITKQIRSYLVLKTIISIGTGSVFGFAAFLFGVDFPIFWGFWAFLLNFIPTIGPVIATIPVIILMIIQFDSLWWILFSSIVLSSIQFISGSFVEPKIMGDNLNLNIIAILLSLFLWGSIWGIAGMLLAVPILVTINIICANIPKLEKISILLSK